MMGKLSTLSNNQGWPFRPQVYLSKGRGQGRNNYYNRVGSEAGLGQTVEIDFQDHPREVDFNMDKILEEETSEEEFQR